MSTRSLNLTGLFFSVAMSVSLSLIAFSFSGRIGDDGHRGRSSQSRSTRRYHLGGRLGIANAARGLDAHVGAHGLAHQAHVLGRGAAAAKAGGSLDEIGARFLRHDAGADLL